MPPRCRDDHAPLPTGVRSTACWPQALGRLHSGYPMQMRRRPSPRTARHSHLRGRIAAPGVAIAVLILCGLCVPSVVGLVTSSKAFADVPEATSVTYQIDSNHDGDQTSEVLPTAPVQEWSHTFDNSVSYPLIVGNRVFVTVSTDGNATGPADGSRLYANASDGTVLWGPTELDGDYDRVDIAYDNGRVFATNEDGLMRSFDAANGSEEWSVDLPRQMSFTSPPSAENGVVYVSGSGNGGTLYAVNEADGTLLWTAACGKRRSKFTCGELDRVYVSYDCEQTYDFAPLSHHWRIDLAPQPTSCEGGGGRTSVLHDGSLYVRDAFNMAPVVLSSTTGEPTGTFTSSFTPAFDGSLEFTLDDGVLPRGGAVDRPGLVEAVGSESSIQRQSWRAALSTWEAVRESSLDSTRTQAR